MRLTKVMLYLLLIVACSKSDQEDKRERPNSSDKKIEELRKQLLKLQGTTDALAGLISSDYSTCPASGDTADALIRKICQVAQASTVESRVLMKGEMSTLVNVVQSKLDATGDQLGDLQTSHEEALIDLAAIEADILDLQADVTALEADMTTAEAAIVALEASVASISGTLTGTMNAYDIGVENVSSGPTYETVLRRGDKTRINAFIDSYSTWLALANNPADPTTSSVTVTITKPVTTVTISNASPAVVTWATHGWVNGDPVMFSTTGGLPTGLSVNTLYYVRSAGASTFNVSATPTGSLINTSSAGSGVHSGSLGLVAGDLVGVEDLNGGCGFTRGQVSGEFLVKTGATTTLFNIDLSRTASCGAVFGASLGIIRRVQGRGMATVWKTADGADVAVRQTTLGTRRYNFIVKANGDICYDTANNAATFGTIDAGGGSVVCK